MASIGSWYLKSIPARVNESVENEFSANFLRSGDRPLGGKLYLTSERVIFTCHYIDAWFGGESFERDLRDIVSVERTEADEQDAYAGGGQPRLRIVDIDGTEGIFIVHGLSKAIRVIDNAVAKTVDDQLRS